MATRVVIATQEPTLSPSILDLCNVTIVHRFISPAWFKALEGHLAGACLGAAEGEGSSKSGSDNLFRKIVKLRTGEAFVFCPSAILDVFTRKTQKSQSGESAYDEAAASESLYESPDGSASDGSGELVTEEDQGNESDGLEEGEIVEGEEAESGGTSGEGSSESVESVEKMQVKKSETHIRPVRVQELGARYIRLKVRNRVTADGGRSILAE